MTILSIETSTEALSVALEHKGEIFSHHELAPRKHGELLLPTIDKLLSEADAQLSDVEYMVYGCGPGAFTGIRIAVSAIQGLAFGVGCKVVGISSLQSLAAQAFKETDSDIVIVANDARMREVYYAVYQRDTTDGALVPVLLSLEQVGPPYQFSEQEIESAVSGKVDLKNAIGAGSGWKVYAETMNHQFPSIDQHLTELYPRADVNIGLAKAPEAQSRLHEASLAVPVYLRNNVAAKSSKKK
ncbi:MAG: tRNA (adenosine(37)-N6)-threonylcarbamoyltransferase complex dimerization subunit type 1 TsaB [Gammaproteobacteria bacterium]|nr:tRNA (adenosine(37)-N6)-threonylcarbamoyltransferase complex dimerization subunit type 1 TsaB [Gammaproteobacteria bacterium]